MSIKFFVSEDGFEPPTTLLKREGTLPTELPTDKEIYIFKALCLPGRIRTYDPLYPKQEL